MEIDGKGEYYRTLTHIKDVSEDILNVFVNIGIHEIKITFRPINRLRQCVSKYEGYA